MSEFATFEMFTMRYDDEHTFPFIEDENGNITGYGWQDKAEFAEAINQYDEVATGEVNPEDERWGADHITHLVVRLGHDGETIQPCDSSQYGTFPVTALWGQR